MTAHFPSGDRAGDHMYVAPVWCRLGGITVCDPSPRTVKAVAPKSVNFLMVNATNFSVNDLTGMSVRRISTGGTMARTAWNGFIRAAREIAEQGTFKNFEGVVPNAELNAFFREDVKKRAKS